MSLMYFCVSPVQGEIHFTDVTNKTGITFRHTIGASGKYHIVETVGAGLALFDYDLDGLIDLYFLNGSHHDANPAGPAPRNALYRNEGNWRFRDVTDAAGCACQGKTGPPSVSDFQRMFSAWCSIPGYTTRRRNRTCARNRLLGALGYDYEYRFAEHEHENRQDGLLPMSTLL